MPRPLAHRFFSRPTLHVARELIGCTLVRKHGNEISRSMITEVEAYDGFRDQASHAWRGKTRRNEIMWRSGGHIYVYFTYGMHWMLNVVTGPAEYPAAVLIRGLKTISGPGRLTKALRIDGSLNGKKLGKKTGLWIEPRQTPISARSIVTSPRIGVEYAGPLWAPKKYRFCLKLAVS